ncbi:MAG TPA: EamA family transporter, partial [Roseovarius nubinhibens]|nr:EamA family transporter [Roseovarius nubinhibens]
MTRQTDLALTALAPAIWGSTYIVTTELLPPGHPLGMAMLRALPAGLLLILLLRQMPPRRWLGRIFLLGALNFTLFWGFLFLAAYRLPGGVAATLGAVQPLFVLFLSRALLGSATPPLAILAALAGIGGVGLLVLSPEAQLDPVGIAAGLGGAASMALGMVLSRRWTPPVSALTFTAWQLAAGGLLLLPLALWLEPPLPALDRGALLGLLWLGLAG